MSGVITKQFWANPHSALYVEVKNAQGGTETWILYGLPPNMLSRLGHTKETFREGLAVTAIGWPAKDRASAAAMAGSLASSGTQTWQMMEVGEVRFADGKITSFGRGPSFNNKNFSERIQP